MLGNSVRNGASVASAASRGRLVSRLRASSEVFIVFMIGSEAGEEFPVKLDV